MTISTKDVVIGGIYATATHQERRVTKIEAGKVFYEARSEKLKNAWDPGHALASPPSLESFAAACERVVSKP
jgi:hypothetical protein